jgi:hypothetical protein
VRFERESRELSCVTGNGHGLMLSKNKFFIKKRSQSMEPTAVKSAAKKPENKAEPLKLLNRIGSTTYEVSVHFSKTSKETLEDKILRLIEREAINNA